MLIRHNERPSEAPKGKESKSKVDKKVAVRERDLSELKHFVRDQIEKYRSDRDRLEQELIESRQDVEALSEQVSRLKELLLEHRIDGLEKVLTSPPGTPTPRNSPVRVHEEDFDRERYEVKGAAPSPESGNADDAVLPPIEPPVKLNHLSTTEILFVRAKDAHVDLPPAVSGTVWLSIVTAIAVCVAIGLLYSEEILDLLGAFLGTRGP